MNYLRLSHSAIKKNDVFTSYPDGWRAKSYPSKVKDSKNTLERSWSMLFV